MPHASPPAVLTPRGVWTASFTTADGEAILLAIDSRHRRVREVIIPPGADPRLLVDELVRELDDIDPPIRLRALA